MSGKGSGVSIIEQLAQQEFICVIITLQNERVVEDFLLTLKCITYTAYVHTDCDGYFCEILFCSGGHLCVPCELLICSQGIKEDSWNRWH